MTLEAVLFDVDFTLVRPGPELGPQFGVSGEYSLDHNLNIGAQMRFGPQFYSVSGSGTDLAFTTEVVIGYRL